MPTQSIVADDFRNVAPRRGDLRGDVPLGLKPKAITKSASGTKPTALAGRVPRVTRCLTAHASLCFFRVVGFDLKRILAIAIATT